MRILHVAPSYFPAIRYGGPIWSVHGLAKGQAELGHDVHVFTTDADGPNRLNVPLEQPVNLDGVNVRYFPLGFPARLYRTPAMLRALRAEVETFDVVHVHSVFLWPTLKAARAALRKKTPYVVSPRGMLVKELLAARSGLLKRAWITLFERRTLENAAFIHVTAAVEAEELKAFGFALPRIVSIANGVEPPGILDGDRISSDVQSVIGKEPYILSLGRLSWKKNLIALIDAVATIPDARLIIAGNDEDGHALELEQRIAALSLEGRVSLLARSVNGADKEALFEGCQMFALPSLSENFGNTALEAMARAKPVVVSAGCGVSEVVAEAEGGLVCASDAPALSEAIAALWRDPARAQSMGQSGERLAASRYGWRHIAATMIDAYAGRGAL